MVQRGDHVVVGQPVEDAVVWMVPHPDLADERHGHIWIERWHKVPGFGVRHESKRLRVAELVVVDIEDLVYEWPVERWNPAAAAALRESEMELVVQP